MRRILQEHAAEGLAPAMTRGGATNGHAPVWQTPEELTELIQLREYAVELLPEGEVRHSIRTEIAQLRRRADMARMKAAGACMAAKAENGSDTISSTS